MSVIDLNELWAEAHTLHFDAGKYMPSAQDRWIESMSSMPNGHLLSDNSFFDMVRSNPSKIYILHVTQDIEKIISSSAIYPSAGCLVGCIYGTQLYPIGDNTFKMHNLGHHILTREAVFSGKEPTALIIEISYEDIYSQPVLAGLNYLKLGKIHHTIYESLRHLLSVEERRELELIVTSKIKRSLDFISLCYYNDHNTPIISSRDFIAQIGTHIPNLAILGYIFFEAISEYTMLMSTDQTSNRYSQSKEFNNTIYKSFLIDIYNRIGKFKLSDFSLSAGELEEKITSMRDAGMTDIEIDDFFDYIRSRVSHMVSSLLLTDPSKEPGWLDVSWDYSGFSSILRPLVGHAIHRELRNFNRYKDFYFYFDQLKALSAWNYWNKMNVSLPFNGPLHKGEIGINPAYQGARYRIFKGVLLDESSSLLKIEAELKNVELVPRLIDLRHTAMRSSDHANKAGVIK